MRISPFQALCPPSNLAQDVAAPPYDTVDGAEAAALAADKPYSFLHISRAEIDLPPDVDPYADAVYQKAADTLEHFIRKGVLVHDAENALYVYRIVKGDHVQTGLVACCHVEDYERNVILRHEKTRQDKENDRLRHILTLRTHSGPVFLTYRDVAAIDEMVAVLTREDPQLCATAEDGSVHAIWRATGDLERLVKAFAGVPVCYVADGHHRAAAAVRAAVELRKANPAHTGEEPYNWFLSVLFPASHLRIMPYNRCVGDLNGLTPAKLLQRIREAGFTVTPDAGATPPAARRAAMYLGGHWYGLAWTVPPDADAVAALDVSVLQDRLLNPILGIQDPRTSTRIEFVGGIRGTDSLARRVDAGSAAVAFSLFPVTVEDVMRVADAGRIMPPKSTWFEPKLRSGLVVHTF